MTVMSCRCHHPRPYLTYAGAWRCRLCLAPTRPPERPPLSKGLRAVVMMAAVFAGTFAFVAVLLLAVSALIDWRMSWS